MARVRFAWFMWFVGVWAALGYPTCESEAQGVASTAVLLARVCVSEAGWLCFRTGDGYAIHEATLARVGPRGTYRGALTRYSRRATGVEPTNDERLAWVSELNERGRRPMRWPGEPHMAWSRYRARWLAVVGEARTVVTLTMDDRDEWSVCDDIPTDWAAPAHVPSEGVVRVDCGDTLNPFYRRRVAW